MKTVPGWAEEVKQCGLKQVLLDRARFHDGLPLSFATRHTGRAKNSVKRQLRRLTEAGHLSEHFVQGDWFYRPLA